MHTTDTAIFRRFTMKHETFILLLKGMCFLVIGFFTPLTTALTQFQANGDWPQPIVWVVVLSLCIIGGASAILSYLSGSYSDYLKKKQNGYDKTINPPSTGP